MTKTEQEFEKLVMPKVVELGYELYDVMYVKEGPDWYLRLFIDSEKGIDLDDCEKVSRSISDLLDEKDPIETSYNLEVSSCGLERHLRNQKHFNAAIGKNIEIKFFKNINGKKGIVGNLLEVNGDNINVKSDDEIFTINTNDISNAKILYNWEDLKDE